MKFSRRAIIFVNTWKGEARILADEILNFLCENSINADIYNYDGLSIDKPAHTYDFAITLGGDGTVLFAARFCGILRIPIFPINLGEFGFIAGIEPSAWKKSLQSFLNGTLYSVERMLISARVERRGETIFSSDALNDVVVSGSGIAKIVRLEVLFNGLSFGTYKADGIIVATPTGSTAYSAASGGPIVDPDLQAFVLTPISAFSLSNRPIVLPATGTLKISVLDMRHRDAMVTIDGQEVFQVFEGDSVFLEKTPYPIHLIGCESEVFYKALRSKLNWAGAPVPLRECGDSNG